MAEATFTRRRGFSGLGLRWLLVVLLAALTTLLVAAVAVSVGEEGVRSIRANSSAQLEGKAQQIAARFDRHLYERWLFHRIAGEGVVIGRVETPAATKRSAMQRFQRFFADLAVLAIIDEGSVVRLGEPSTTEGRRVAGWDGSGAPLAIALAPSLLATDGTLVPTYLLSFGAGAAPGHAMLAAQLDWKFIAVISDLVPLDQFADHGTHLLLLADDSVLERSQDGMKRIDIDAAARTSLAQLGGQGTMILWEGRRHLGARASLRGEQDLPALAITVVLLQDIDQAFESVAELRRTIILLGAGFVMLSALVGWRLAGWIASPLNRVATAAAQADVTGRSVELPRSTRYAEIAVLGDALSHMLRRLEEQAARLATAFQTSLDAVITIDERGTIGAFNDSAEKMFGHAAADVIGKDVLLLMPEPYASEHSSYLRRYLDTGERRMIGSGRVVRARRRDGSTFACQLSVGESRLSDGRRVFTGFIRDLSNLQEVEAQLRTAQSEVLQMNRLITVGQVGSQLSHELNQPLGAIANYVQAARHILAAPDVSRERLDELLGKLHGQATRASEIVRRLRRFVASSPAARQAENVNALVEQSLALAIVGAVGARVRVETRLAAGLPRVVVDRIQIQQVLTNLIRNAVEAMAQSEPAILEIRTGTESGSVVCEIADRGPGIDPAIAGRLFMPFVTTKPDGLGLGLSICRSIVEGHDGRLIARPNPLGGTIFSMSLPYDAASA